MDPFDFQAWRRMAEQNPQGYFRAREKAIESFICRDPSREAQLRELQGRIDRARATAGAPAPALREIFSMLHGKLDALAGELQSLRVELERCTGAMDAAQPRRTPRR